VTPTEQPSWQTPESVDYLDLDYFTETDTLEDPRSKYPVGTFWAAHEDKKAREE
jgi:hypothetical protein